MNRKNIITICPVFLLYTTLFAQTEQEDTTTIHTKRDALLLNQITVTATRFEVARKDAPIVCNLITDRLLNATQSLTLSEGLSFQPALRVEDNCQNCGFTGLRMNGLESAYSQILIDGRPIYNSLQGVYGLEQIPSNMIERVEIVRSGGSALYGSSAIAGTVNVITKEPKENDFYLSGNVGLIGGKSTDQTYMVGGNMITKHKNAAMTLNGFVRQRQPWDADGDGFSEIGKLQTINFSFKGFYKPTPYSKIIVQGYTIYEYRRGGNKFDLAPHQTDITETTTHNILNGGITYEQYTKNKNHKFSIYTTVQNLNRDSYYGAHQDPNAYGNSKGFGVVAGGQYSGKLGQFLGGKHIFVAGAEYTLDNLNDNAPSYNRFIHQQSNQIGIYAQDDWALLDKWHILLGVRLDKNNFIKNPIISPRVNLLYDITNDLQFRIGYARGFRSPQVFDEDLHITQVSGRGTIITNIPNLKPEYSNAFSASLDYNTYIGNDWSLGVTLDGFYTLLTDVFVLEETGTTENSLLMQRRNGQGADVLGITINPKLNYKNKIEFQAGFTLQKSEYKNPVQWSATLENTTKRFLRTPNTYGFYVFTWNITDHFTINLSGVYTGSMIASHFAGYIPQDRLEKTPSFFENNVKVEYTLDFGSHYHITFSGGVQNYTNAYQKDFDKGADRDSGYVYGPGRPRTYFLGAKFSL